jgi:NAD(P)-dependent dehydrogenase (short-subunit alcohol dehydrogenase family)
VARLGREHRGNLSRTHAGRFCRRTVRHRRGVAAYEAAESRAYHQCLLCGQPKVGPGFAVYAATKHAVRALSEGLRQEVKPYNIRTTVISPGAVATELPNSVTEPDIAERIHKFYKEIAIPAESFARAVAFAMSQPEDVDVNEILFRPTRQEL